AVRGSVGAGQAMPAFLRRIRQVVRVTMDEFETAPQPLDESLIDAFVREVLLSERRTVPVFVLAPQEAGDYLVDPETLAEEFVGLGPLYVMARHATTFRLTDSLGDKRLSCFYGALRVYLPGFTCADEPTHHPLMLRDRLLDPIERTALVGQLAQRAAREITLPTSVMRDAVTPTSAVATAGAPRTAVEREVPAAPLTERASPRADVADTAPAPVVALADVRTNVPVDALLRAFDGVSQRLDALTRVVEQLIEQQRVSRDELTRVRTSAAVRAASTASLERRFEALEQLVRGAMGIDPVLAEDQVAEPAVRSLDESDALASDEDDDPRPSLRDVLRQAAASQGDALLVLDAADRAAAESPFEDIDRVALVFDAMATLARRRMEGGLGVTLREAFREHGIDYRSSISSSTAERLRKQYRVRGDDGVMYDCREHLVLGNAYDPRYCLRIYFTSRHPGETRFVIGHVGRHFDVKSTS
nr:hypothetical protein [Gemmatimonadaceae bacterium]